MSKHDEHGHDHKHHEHGATTSKKRPIHHDWRFWVAVVLMLAAMGAYVATMDEALQPGGKGGNIGQEMPAAP